ncbi:MAG TPA: cellulose binding domain-containing protein [Actinoplanes sp.]
MRTQRKRRVLSAMAAGVAGIMTATVLAVQPFAQAATGDGTPTDPNIAFIGRWDRSTSTAFKPNWQGAYFKTGFTGTTVKLRQRNAIDLYYSIDGGSFTYLQNVRSTVNLTPTPLNRGNHTLRVSYRNVDGSYTGDAVFQGLILDAGATTLATPVSSRTIEFVGDSITRGSTSSMVTLTSYGWLTGEQLGAEHVQLGYGGGCLVAAADGCASVGDLYTRMAATASSANWDFSRYTANAVVINLGTNDRSHGVAGATFQDRYVSLIRTIRSKYPAAAIYALRTFSGRYAAETTAAVSTINNGGDRNVYYVDTTGWLPSNGLSDSVHPNDVGHRAIAAKLAPIVGARMNSGPTTTPPRTTIPTTAPTTTPPTTAPTTTPPAGTTPTAGPSACSVAYVISNQWQGGFQGDVTIRNTGSSAVNGWTLQWTFPNGQTIGQAWNATVTGSGSTATVTNVSWNGSLPAGGTATFGFTGTWNGTNGKPAAFTLNGAACSVA